MFSAFTKSYLPFFVASAVTTTLLIGTMRLIGETDDALLNNLRRHASAMSFRAFNFRDTQHNDQYWSAVDLQRRMQTALGIPVFYSPLPDSVQGMSTSQGRYVLVSDQLSWNGRMQAMAHEAGHMLQPFTLQGSAAEVFAESVGYLVCQHAHMGDESLESSARYLSGHKAELAVIDQYRSDIEWAVAVLDGPR